MKDTDHSAVHGSVHLCGERKLYGAQRLRFARRLILDADKNPGWAGATPLTLPRKPWRSLQPSRRLEMLTQRPEMPVSKSRRTLQRRIHVDHQ